MTHPRIRRADRRGATLVEFAIVAPLFFLVVLTMFEFTRLNVLRHTADNAAYEAARAAMVPGSNAASAKRKARQLLNIVGAQGAKIRVTPAKITQDTEEVTVTVSVPLNRNGWVAPKFTKGKTFTASSTMRTERVRTR